MPSWPTSLPAPALNSLNEAPADNSIRSNMDKGPAKIRRRTTANTKPLTFNLKLTSEQVDTLFDFYADDLLSGSEPFDMLHPRTDQPITCRFTERPQSSENEGVVFVVSVALEIMP